MSSTLKAALAGIRQIADHFEKPDDDFEPVVFLHGADKTAIFPCGPFMENETKKDLLAEIVLPKLIRELKIEEVVTVFSAWVVRRDPGEETDGPRPSEDPNRVEVVLVNRITKDGVQEIVTAYQSRDPRGIDPPTLSEFDYNEFSDRSEYEGLFVAPLIAALKEVSHGTPWG